MTPDCDHPNCVIITTGVMINGYRETIGAHAHGEGDETTEELIEMAARHTLEEIAGRHRGGLQVVE